MSEARNEVNGPVVGVVVQVGGNATIRLPESVPSALSGLPPASDAFTGRQADLDLVHAQLSSTKPWTVIAGLPGVGKTELALQAARTTDKFPGGALLVNLAGYASTPQLTPNAALDSLLTALGVPANVIPAEEQDRSRLFRTVLRSYAEAGRPILLILDNANSLAQVEPLLPTDETTGLIVTSRDTLTLLTTKYSAALRDLDVLDPDSARRLLGPRAATDPAAAAVIARLCGFLPLALEIVAALLAEDPHRPPRAMAEDLADECTRLDELDHPDKAVRASFDLSYRRLAPELQRVLRQLGLHPGPDIATAAVAALTGRSARTARKTLLALARTHLIQHTADTRWQFHDLIRLYARERAAEDSFAQQTEAFDGLLSYYRENLDFAVFRLWEQDENLLSPLSNPFAGAADAVGWMNIEYRNLTALLDMSGKWENDDVTVWLTCGLVNFEHWRGNYFEALQFAKLGVVAARRQYNADNAEVKEYVLALDRFGLAFEMARRPAEAVAVFRLALGIAGDRLEPAVKSNLLRGLGDALIDAGQLDLAVSTGQDNVELCHASLGPEREGEALVILGGALQKAGQVEDAVAILRRAVELFRRIDGRKARFVWMSEMRIGDILRELGQCAEAAEVHRQLAADLRHAGDRHAEGNALLSLSLSLGSLSQLDEAADVCRRAAMLFEETEQVREASTAWQRLSLWLLELGRRAEAEETLKRAVTLEGETGGVPVLVAAWPTMLAQRSIEE